MTRLKSILALLAIFVVPPGIGVALWIYVIGAGFAAEARVNQFLPIMLGMATALDEHDGWERTLETGCSRPLTRFEKGWSIQDVPSDYQPTYLDCVQPVMYGGCYPYSFGILGNCLRIAVHRFVLSQPDVLKEIVSATIDPCRYAAKGDEDASYFLHQLGKPTTPKDAALTGKLNEQTCKRIGPVDYVIYVLNDDRSVFLKLSVSRS